MGQAKLRGSYQERKDKPRMPSFDKMTNSEILLFCESDTTSKFRGFIIHSLSRDDFLYKISENSYTMRRQYTKNPKEALIYETFKKAENMLKKVPNECVVGLLIEEPEQIKVCYLESNK